MLVASRFLDVVYDADVNLSVWILYVDRQLPFERDTESAVHPEVFEFTTPPKAMGLLAS